MSKQDKPKARQDRCLGIETALTSADVLFGRYRVERNFGYAVARAYAGHSGGENDASTTTYVRATIHEVAVALAALTSEPHPLSG